MEAERAYNSGHRRCTAAKADMPIVLALVCRDCFVCRPGFFDWDSVLLPITSAFLMLTLVVLGFGAKQHQRYGPFVAGVVASAAILTGGSF